MKTVILEPEQVISDAAQREAAVYGEVVQAAEVLQGKLTALAEVRRDLLALNVEPLHALPAPLIRSVTFFLDKLHAPPELSDRERRILELRTNVERARNVLDTIKRSGVNDHSAQQNRANVETWLKRSESELLQLERRNGHGST